jgi:anti-anti-sigma factor
MPIQQWSQRIWVVQLGDEPGFTEDLATVHEASTQAQFLPDIVLDLSGVKHVNSSQLSALLRMRKNAIDNDARLRLAQPCDPVWAVFLATGLDKVFEFTPDVTIALAELQIR